MADERIAQFDATVTATVYRVRVAHSHTLKDGWRCSETTVEATGVEIDSSVMRSHMQEAYALGLEEAQRRNRMDNKLMGRTSSAEEVNG